MKRFTSSDSLAALLPISSPKEEKSPESKQAYSREFQAMLDGLEEEDYTEEGSQTTEKKRRLTLVQVKALEKNFEVENKLEPGRKEKLAEELGLQPRQVAIWFQNRRARWKTKQLERDYGILKANYDALKLNYSNLEQEREALTEKLRELKAKLREENADSNHSVKAESPISEPENNVTEQSKKNASFYHGDCTGIIKDNSNLNMNAHLLISPVSSSNGQTLMNWFQLSDSRPILGNGNQPQFVKLEEQSVLFTTEESCNFLSVDQAPTLQWHFPGQ